MLSTIDEDDLEEFLKEKKEPEPEPEPVIIKEPTAEPEEPSEPEPQNKSGGLGWLIFLVLVLCGKLRAAETAAYFRRYSLPDCACGHQTAHNHYDERRASVTC